jgi:hypothetical protein
MSAWPVSSAFDSAMTDMISSHGDGCDWFGLKHFYYSGFG